MELQWPLILFTTFMAWSMGVLGTQGVLALNGSARKAQLPALITSLVLMVIGGVSVFFHLQHWERIFNGFGHITSGITQELIAIVIAFVIMVVYFVALRRSGEKQEVSKVIAVLAIVIAVVTDFVMGHSYMMSARPAWDNILQIGSLLGASCAMGPLTLIALMRITGETAEPAATPAVIGTALGAVLTAAYAVVLSTCTDSFSSFTYYWDPANPTVPMADVASTASEQTLLLWAGAILVGAVLPFVLAIVGKKINKDTSWLAIAIIALILAVAGAIILRVVFYNMGICFFTSFTAVS